MIIKQELLNKLQQKISKLSCNSLQRVYPLQIQEWTGATNKEIKEFIQSLLEERLIAVKFDFQCECGNNCTAYQRSLDLKPYQCVECEREYNQEEVMEKAVILYELDKQAILDYNQEEVNFKNIVRETSKVVPITIKQEEKVKMDKKKIFIGSSTSVIPRMEEIARIIDDLGFEALPWNSKGKEYSLQGNILLIV